MNRSLEIRKFYKPVQPTVDQASVNVSYTEFLPDIQLQEVIYCYWQLKTSEVLTEPFSYRVVADGCIDIFFELTNPADSYVMGFCKKFTEFPLDNSFNYVGIRFFPTMFPQLFKINAKELSNHFEHLDQVVPAVSDFIRNTMDSSQSREKIGILLDTYFLEVIKNGSFDRDERLYGALQLIFMKKGILDVEADLQTGISSRQLRRLFDFYIGVTPKIFSQVVRFQAVLGAKPYTESLRENKLFFDAGYYDQAHFIKEFKNFYGVTPGKAFGR